MTLRCDHCRKQLSLIVRRYWHMRFCSAVCMKSYQHRLDDETRMKIRHLDFITHGDSRKLGTRLLGNVIRQLAG
jgi:hypothetical protein